MICHTACSVFTAAYTSQQTLLHGSVNPHAQHAQHSRSARWGQLISPSLHSSIHAAAEIADLHGSPLNTSLAKFLPVKKMVIFSRQWLLQHSSSLHAPTCNNHLASVLYTVLWYQINTNREAMWSWAQRLALIHKNGQTNSFIDEEIVTIYRWQTS